MRAIQNTTMSIYEEIGQRQEMMNLTPRKTLIMKPAVDLPHSRWRKRKIINKAVHKILVKMCRRRNKLESKHKKNDFCGSSVL